MPYFDAHTNRVDKINSPLLVIGFGGTGADGVLRVKHEFSQRFNPEVMGTAVLNKPPRTAYLVLDTDENTKSKRYRGTMLEPDTEFVSMQCDIEFLLAENGHNLTPEVKLWLDEKFYLDPDLRKNAATEGAGTYRQLSRLMLFQKMDDVTGKLQTVMNSLAQMPAGAPRGAKKINVAIFTGLSGGTGSGTFLDMAYLVREAARRVNQPVIVDLYAVAPDVTIQHHAVNDEKKKKIYQVNSFAALKELDYWMSVESRKTGKLGDSELEVKYPGNQMIVWKERPFDTVTLLCATNANRVLLANAYQIVMNSFAESLVFTYATETEQAQDDIVGGNHSEDDDSFSFQSARSNEFAYLREIPRPFPEAYYYRAIGAYSNLSEQRNRVSIEGNELFQDLKAFCLAQEEQETMDGTQPDKFFEKAYTERAGLLWDEFDRAVNIPTEYFSKRSPFSKSDIKGLGADRAPHADPFRDWEKDAREAASNLRGNFSSALIESFQKQCVAFLKEHGPRALNKMLTTPDVGIIAKYDAKLTEIDGLKTRFATEHGNQYTNARQEYDTWTSLGGLSLRGVIDLLTREDSAFETYIQVTAAQYQTKENQLFYEELYKGLRAVLDHARTVTANVLSYAIKAIDTVAAELEDDVKSIPTGGGAMHVVSLEEIKKSIRETYQAEENGAKLRNQAMNCIADCLTGNKSVTNDTEAAEVLIDDLQEMLDAIYHTLNDMSLAAQLQRAGVINQEDSVQAYTKKTLAPELERGAEVHFALSSSYGSLSKNNAVLTSYVSVPENQPAIRAGIKSYLQDNANSSGAVIKNSAIHDRIFWLNIHSGLPLCAYAFLDEYETVYEENKGTREGIHLLMNRQDGMKNDIRFDWRNLPSPNPYMLWSGADHAAVTLVKRRTDCDAISSAAEAAGVLKLDYSDVTMEQFSASLSLLATAGNRAMTAKEYEAAMASLGARPEEDSEGEQLKLESRLAVLEKMLNTRTADMRLPLDRISDRAARFATDQNVSTEMAMSSHDAYEKCFRAYVYYTVSKRPVLSEALQEHTRMVNALTKEIDGVKKRIEHLAHQGDAVRSSAVVVAELLMFNEIQPKIGRYLYRDMSGAFTTDSGENNVLFTLQTDGLHRAESWSARLPMEFALAEWMAAQNPEDEPLPTIMSRLEEKRARCSDADPEVPEDIEMLRDYYERAKKYIESLKKTENGLRSREAQQAIKDAQIYKQVLEIIVVMRETLQNNILIWEPYV